MGTQAKTQDKRRLAHVAAVQAILAEGNVALQGEGTRLWENNSAVMHHLFAFVKTSASGNFYLQPNVEGVTDKDGNQAKSFRIFAGPAYAELETYQDGDEVYIEVIQRTPKPKQFVTDDEIRRINEWAEERAREEGRTMTGKATAAWEEALAKGLVSYLVQSIEEV